MNKFIIGIVLLVFAYHAEASWNTSPIVNTPIVTAANEQTQQSMASDGKGGAIIAWQDSRGTNPDIYAQRIDAWGNVKWAANGIAICLAADVQSNPIVVADNNGGAYIVWLDARNSGSSASGSNDTDVYMTHVDSSGNLTWSSMKGYSNGMPVCVKSVEKNNLQAIADGMGGVFVVWNDYRTCLADTDSTYCAVWNYNYKGQKTTCKQTATVSICAASISTSSLPSIFLQHVNINDTMWTTDSLGILTSDTNKKNPQTFPTLVADGNGGVYLLWENVQPTATQIYCQHFDNTGAMQYPSTGNPVCTISAIKNNLTAASDNNGGFVAAWEDNRNSTITGTDIYAQRILANGKQGWTQAGIPVVQLAGQQLAPSVVCDGEGDAYVVWQDYRNGFTPPMYYGADLYGQLLNAGDGSAAWTANGAAMVSAQQDQLQQQIALDDSGGLFLVWQDNRAEGNSSETSYLNAHIYAKDIRSDSTVVWGGATGVPVCTAPNEQSNPLMLPANNSLICVWHDERNLNSTGGDLYAQWILPPGDSALSLPANSLDFGGVVPGDTALQLLTVNNNFIATGESIDSVKSTDPHFYYKKPVKIPVIPLGGSAKLSIGFTPAGTSSYATDILVYSHMINTPDTVYASGNGSGGPYLQTDSNTLNFGNVQSGMHDTNTVQIKNTGNAQLTISSATMTQGVFQAALPSEKILSAGGTLTIPIVFSPVSGAAYSDTLTLMSNSPTSPDKIFLFGSGVVTDVEEIPSSSSFALNQNYPNPFRAATTFRFTLPAAERADVSIYDMLGRQIATIASGIFSQGSHDAVFDGNNLPTGMYTCVLQTTTARIARNIVLVH